VSRSRTHSRAHRSTTSSRLPLALSRFPATSGAAVSHNWVPGTTLATEAGQVTMCPPWSPRMVTLAVALSARNGADCSPAPMTRRSESSNGTHQSATAGAPPADTHNTAAFLIASATTAGFLPVVSSLTYRIFTHRGCARCPPGRRDVSGFAVPQRPAGPTDVRTVAAVVVALAAVSSSAPLIAFAAAPALAIAFWRNGLAAAVLGPVSWARRRDELRWLARGPGRRVGRYSVLAGLALAAHFGTWMPSVQLTSVAAATALVATQPVWQGLIARWQGQRLARSTWLGIALAVSGAGLATGADFAVSSRAFAGDLLAIAGAVAVAIYTAFGERARTAISTTTYTTVCYGVCGLVLLVVCVSTGVPLAGFDAAAWVAILGLVAGAQLLGHSMFNYVLHRLSATTVSVLILLEAPGAALIAWAWLGQVPRAVAVLGIGLLLAGVAIVVIGSARSTSGPLPAAREADPLP
jgi:drug/metabolite transporter (DMT)-like permease